MALDNANVIALDGPDDDRLSAQDDQPALPRPPDGHEVDEIVKLVEAELEICRCLVDMLVELQGNGGSAIEQMEFMQLWRWHSDAYHNYVSWLSEDMRAKYVGIMSMPTASCQFPVPAQRPSQPPSSYADDDLVEGSSHHQPLLHGKKNLPSSISSLQLPHSRLTRAAALRRYARAQFVTLGLGAAMPAVFGVWMMLEGDTSYFASLCGLGCAILVLMAGECHVALSRESTGAPLFCSFRCSAGC